VILLHWFLKLINFKLPRSAAQQTKFLFWKIHQLRRKWTHLPALW
jgi:hypothetical protein